MYEGVPGTKGKFRIDIAKRFLRAMQRNYPGYCFCDALELWRICDRFIESIWETHRHFHMEGCYPSTVHPKLLIQDPERFAGECFNSFFFENNGGSK